MAETIVIETGTFSFLADADGPADGPLVLLLHGFPQSRHAWRHELPALAHAGFRAVAVDQRGYSPDARPLGVEAYRMEHLVSDVLAIADALGAASFDLVGHDWGGQVAWVTASCHPPRVRSLTVLSRPHPAAFVAAMRNDSAQASRSSHHRRFDDPETAARLLADDAQALRNLFGGDQIPASVADAYVDTLGTVEALESALNWYRAVGTSAILPRDVGAVSVPTLYVWGNADQTVGRMAAEGTGNHVTGSYRFVELADVGHFITDEAPGATAPILLDHLEA